MTAVSAVSVTRAAANGKSRSNFRRMVIRRVFIWFFILVLMRRRGSAAFLLLLLDQLLAGFLGVRLERLGEVLLVLLCGLRIEAFAVKALGETGERHGKGYPLVPLAERQHRELLAAP